MSYKGQEVKFYIDQYRMFYVPECYCPAPRKCSVLFRNPKTVVIKNFRITTGTGNNTINDILTNNTLTTHDINFDLRASTIKQSSIEFISQMAYWLKNNPDVALEIVGHTDNEGQEPANIKLSKERAEAVKAQLVLLGVTTSRLTTNGMGSARPLQTNKTVEGRANNRRVEFIRK
jgi:outer membrane protein OmpA-like peptidoglycan-associated protein